MNNYTVVYDACVLYPAPLRDFLMHLAVVGVCRAKWTDQIHDEWTRNVLKDRQDLTAEQLKRTRALMDAHVLDALVIGYEDLIAAITLPDPNDRHVLAAAIRGNASAIITFNLKDFPDSALEKYGIEALHPDEFIALQLDLAPNLVCLAAKRQRAMLKNPPKDVEEYLATLEAQRLPQTVSRLRDYAGLI